MRIKNISGLFLTISDLSVKLKPQEVVDVDTAKAIGSFELQSLINSRFVVVVQNFSSPPQTPLDQFVKDETLENGTGDTAGRPHPVPVGYMYFDTSLGYPIWFDGDCWVDALGTVVYCY